MWKRGFLIPEIREGVLLDPASPWQANSPAGKLIVFETVRAAHEMAGFVPRLESAD